MIVGVTYKVSASRFFAGLEQSLLFVASLAIGFVVGTSVTLHTGNPYDILNINNLGFAWNPETNYVQVLLAVFVSALVFWGLSTLRSRGPRAAIALRVLFTGAIALITILIRVVPAAVNATFSDYNSFHYGEQLSPAAALLAGKVPFTDLFVLHGAGEDIFKPALGFLLFNHGVPSIGSYLLISALLEALAVIGFFVLIALLIKTRWLYLAITLWLPITTFAGFTYSKNTSVIVFVLLLWILATKPLLRGRTKVVLLGAAGFIASISILDSIDVGALMGAISAGLAVLMVFVTVTPDGLRFGRPRFGLRSLAPGLVLTAGVVLGQLLTLAILGFGAYLEFLNATFIEIPRYQGLMWGQPLPLMSPEQFITWVPIFALAASVPLIAMLLRRDHALRRWTLAPETLFTVLLLALAVIYTRFAIGRPDGGHIVMAAPFMLLAGFYAIQLALRGTRLDHPAFSALPAPAETDAGELPAPARSAVVSDPRRVPLWPAALIGAVLVLAPGAVLPASLFVNGAAGIEQVRALKNLPNRTDDSWLNDNQRALRDVVAANTTPDESIFVFEPDPSYYFLTDRLNPTRFAISWFMDPEPFTQEALADLKADPPALILWDTDTVFSDTDGIPIGERFPEIEQWIEENYPVQTPVGDSIVRSREPLTAVN